MVRLAKTDSRSLALLAVVLAVALGSGAAHAADKVWTNAGTDGLFGNASNWATTAGGATTVPGFTDVAIFTDTTDFAFASTTSCTLSANIDVAGIEIRSGYTGTLSQSTFTMRVRASNFTLAAATTGTFTGGSASILVEGDLILNGGTFTSTTNTVTVENDLTLAGGTFNASTGSVAFGTSNTLPNQSTITGAFTFNNLTCSSASKTLVFENGVTQTVNGTLSFNGGSAATRIIIQSDSAGNVFSIDPATVGTVMYLDVTDSINLAASPINPLNSVDSGNTTNWFVPTVYYIRADGSGNDANTGADFANALATIGAAITKLALSSSSPSSLLVEFRLAQSTGAGDSYTPASYTGSMNKSFDLTVTGGLDVNTDLQVGRSTILGTGSETGLGFFQTGGAHGMRKFLTATDVDFSTVSTGILVGAGTNFDSVQPSITVINSDITAGSRGVFIDWNKTYSGHGPSTVSLTNVNITSTSNSAVQISAPTPQATIDSCSLTSTNSHGFYVDWIPVNGALAAGGTFVTATDSEMSNCGLDGFHYQNTKDGSGNAHWQGSGVTITLDKLKTLNNGGRGMFVRTELKSAGGWRGGTIDFNATNCLSCNNGSEGIRLEGEPLNLAVLDTDRINFDIVNCTIADNTGDGIHSETGYVHGTTFNIQDLHNTILAGNGGNGLESIDGNDACTTLDETFNDFFSNTGANIAFQGGTPGIAASDVTADPLFSNLLPDPYRPLLTSTILDAGSFLYAPADDILGTARPQGAADSIGAYETGVAPFLANATANGANPFAQGPPVTVTFDSNPTGGTGPYTYLWEDCDALAPAIADNTNKSFSQLFTAEGDYCEQVTVTDSLGNTTVEIVEVFITPPLSTAPTATPAAGFEATGEQWNLFANPVGGVPIPPVGTDPEYTYLWTVLSIPPNPVGTNVSIVNPTDENPTVTIIAPQDALITIQVQVTDNVGTVATGTVDIIFVSTALSATPTIEHTPTSQSGTSVIVVEGETVDLLGSATGGSGSYSFEWEELSQPFTSSLQNDSDTPGSALANPQILTYTLTVTDTYGLTNSATVTATLVDPIVPVPVSTPAFIDLSVAGTSVLSVTATGGAPQAGGTYVDATWVDLTAGSTTIHSGPITDTPTFTPTIVPGLNTVQVTVTDSLGFTGTATLDIFVVESGMTVTAEGTYVIAGTTITGTSLLIFAGDSISLAGTITGGSGVYLIDWTGPGGFTSTAEDPGTVTPPAVAGPYTYTLTVTDVNTGQIVVATVTVTSSESINNQGLFVGNGKCKYKATTASTPESGKDYAKIWLEGVVFNTGDRLAFDFNGRPIGDIAGGSSIVLDSKGVGKGQLGPLFGPNFFPKVTVKYKASRIRLDAKCLKGNFEPFAFGSPMTSAVTGLSPIVNVTVFVDRAPADNVVDDTIVLPLMFKVRAKLSPSGVFTESGKKVAP